MSPAEQAILDALAAEPGGLFWRDIRRLCRPLDVGDVSRAMLDLQARGVVVIVGADITGRTLYGLAAAKTASGAGKAAPLEGDTTLAATPHAENRTAGSAGVSEGGDGVGVAP